MRINCKFVAQQKLWLVVALDIREMYSISVYGMQSIITIFSALAREQRYSREEAACNIGANYFYTRYGMCSRKTRRGILQIPRWRIIVLTGHAL